MASGCDTVTFLSGAFRVAQQETSDGGSAPFGCVFYPTTPYVGLDPPGGTTGNGLTLARPILVPAHAPRQPPQDMLVQTTSYRRTCVCACARVCVLCTSVRAGACACVRAYFHLAPLRCTCPRVCTATGRARRRPCMLAADKHVCPRRLTGWQLWPRAVPVAATPTACTCGGPCRGAAALPFSHGLLSTTHMHVSEC